jgi:hypothetical protein
MILRDFSSDLRTGQIFLKFLQIYASVPIEFNEASQSEANYTRNNEILLEYLKSVEVVPPGEPWLVEDICAGHWGPIYGIAAALAHHFQCPFDLPSYFSVNVVKREKIEGGSIIQKTTHHVITEDESQYHELNRIRSELSKLPLKDIKEDDIWWSLTDDEEREYETDALDVVFEKSQAEVNAIKLV